MKEKPTTRVIIEIRECDWVNGIACKWQGHAYREGGKREPLISGMPAYSPKEAKASLLTAFDEYRLLITEGKEAMSRIVMPTEKRQTEQPTTTVRRGRK